MYIKHLNKIWICFSLAFLRKGNCKGKQKKYIFKLYLNNFVFISRSFISKKLWFAVTGILEQKHLLFGNDFPVKIYCRQKNSHNKIFFFYVNDLKVFLQKSKFAFCVFFFTFHEFKLEDLESSLNIKIRGGIG